MFKLCLADMGPSSPTSCQSKQMTSNTTPAHTALTHATCTWDAVSKCSLGDAAEAAHAHLSGNDAGP